MYHSTVNLTIYNVHLTLHVVQYIMIQVHQGNLTIYNVHLTLHVIQYIMIQVHQGNLTIYNVHLTLHVSQYSQSNDLQCTFDITCTTVQSNLL